MGIRSLFFKATRPDDQLAFILQRCPIRESGDLQLTGFTEKISGNHIYLERGKGRPIIFCSGLYGSIYNVAAVGKLLSDQYRFIVPYLSLYDLPLIDCTVSKLADYLHSFMTDIALKEAIFIGSSMGGGASLYYTLRKDNRSKGIVLCGSSGLSTIPMQKGFFKRKNYAFVKQTTQDIFFDPNTPSENMINQVFNAIQNYEIVLRSIRFTKSTANEQLHDKLKNILAPCLLIWGKQDPITPPATGQLFEKLLPYAELHYLDKCGHVPTQEHPEEVAMLIKKFLQRINYI